MKLFHSGFLGGREEYGAGERIKVNLKMQSVKTLAIILDPVCFF